MTLQDWLEVGLSLGLLLFAGASTINAIMSRNDAITRHKEEERRTIQEWLLALRSAANEVVHQCTASLRDTAGRYGDLDENTETVKNLRQIKEEALEIYFHTLKKDYSIETCVEDIFSALDDLGQKRRFVESERERIQNVPISEASKAKRVLPAWFSERMMGDDWFFGVLTEDGRMIGIRRIEEASADGSWINVELLTKDEIPGDVQCVTAVANDRRLASIQTKSIVMAYDLAVS